MFSKGNNQCAKGYAGLKYCSECEAKTDVTAGFYRQDLSCHECTSMAVFWFTTAVVAILIFIVLIWILTIYEFRLASLNILMDFLQVMALCASIKLNWNAAGEKGWTPRLIEGSNLFAFNLQGFMPACVIENWNYEWLWWYLMLTPPFIFILVMLASMLHLCGSNRKTVTLNDQPSNLSRIMPGVQRRGNRGTKESKERDPSETDSLLVSKQGKGGKSGESGKGGSRRHRRHHKRRVAKAGTINAHAWGAYMILMYYVFGPIVTRSWEPFDCVEFKVGGNQSFFTMEADPTEQCFGSLDGTYWVRLAIFAGFLGVFYTFVAPILLFLTFYRYRHAIEKDLIRSQTHETEGQSWRADLAAKRVQAQMRGVLARKTHGTKMFFARKTKIFDTSVIRKHYGKLYEDFRPEYYYWRFLLMLRKVLLTIVIFFPSSSPVFQATVAIVILFIFFVLQVKYQPYLQRASHPVSSSSSGNESNKGGVVGLFGSLLISDKETGSKTEKQSLLSSNNNNDDNDLAKKRWKRAILVTRTEVRWHHVAARRTKDMLALLFDYNALEMMALACAIMVLLNGIMLETNSLRAPVLGVLKIAPQALTESFVQFIDLLTVVMFLIPCVLLPSSILVDIWRNMAFAMHNRTMEKKKREVALMAARAEASEKGRIESKIEKWRSVQKAKLERDLSILDNDHVSIMRAAKLQYEDDRLDLEDDLKRLLTERVRYMELQTLLRNKTPADAIDAQKLSMDLKKINGAKSAMDDRLLELQDEMQSLDQDYRNKSSQRQEDYAKKRASMNLTFQEALRNKIQGGENASKKSQLRGNMPVQLQMKVLVSQRHFDDKMKSMTLVKEQMAQLERGLGADAAGELIERQKLDKELQEMEDKAMDHHDSISEEKEKRIAELEFSKQDLFGKQKEHSSKMHQIDMAAEAHRRALEKELGPQQYAAYMGAIEQARMRKENATREEQELRTTAAEQGLSDSDIEARLRVIRHACQADCAAYMSTVDATKRSKHAKLVARLAKIKAKEAEELQKVNKAANSGGESADDLEERVRAIQEKAQADVDSVLKANGKDSSAVHARLVKRLEALKQRQLKNEALARMQSSLDGKSPQATVAAVNDVREAAKKEEEDLVNEMMKDEAKEKIQTLEDVATLKANQGAQIYGLLKTQQTANDEDTMSQAELSEAVKRIKDESNDRINIMLKSIGIEADRKHQKMLEKIAARKAKQIAKQEQLKAQRENAQDVDELEQIDNQMERVAIEAESDIEDLTQAVADRSTTKGNKSQKRLTKLLDLAVAHDKAAAEMEDMELARKQLEKEACDIESLHAEETSMVAARTKLAKEQAQEKLDKRLQGRRKKRHKALQHNANARRQLEKESKAMDEFQSKKNKLMSLEEEVAKISEEFHEHAEAQVKAMEDEKARQHKSVAARRAQARARRKKTTKLGDATSVDARTSGALRLMKAEVNETLAKAQMRKAKGKSVKDQLEALLADLKLNLAHQQDTGVSPGAIQKPRLNLAAPQQQQSRASESKQALAAARDQLKEKLSGQKVSRDDAIKLAANRAGKQNLPSLM